MRLFVSVFLLINGLCGGATLRAQKAAPVDRSALTERLRDPRLRAFDIRARTAARTATEREKTLAERGKAAAEASGLAATGAGSLLRVSVGSFGLPKLVFSAEGTLTEPSQEDPESIAKGFLRSNQALFPFTGEEVESLRLIGRETSGGATLLNYQQTVNGIDVFQGAVKIIVDKEGRVAQAGAGDAVPGLRVSSQYRLTQLDAANKALRSLGLKPVDKLDRLPPADQRPEAFQNPLGKQYLPLVVEPAVFPMSASGEARLAYHVILEAGKLNCYELLIDGENGALLYRRSLVRYAAQGRVWKDSPVKGQRELVDFPDGWLPADGTVTTGNNADAYLDTDGNNAPDSKTGSDLQNGRALSPSRVFDFPAGEGSAGQDPRQFQAAALTNAFYLVNVAHDYFYKLGFTELSGNFQIDNFGRGGKAGDAMRVEVQDGSTVAGFTATPDGTPPRIHLGITTRGTYQRDDDRDASYSAQMVFHEYSHGVTSRTLGGTGCVMGVHSGALDEGWADYFAVSYTNDPVFDGYLSADKLRGSRRLSYDHYIFTYEDLGNEGFNSYNDGEIWAAALWDLRKELGQRTADQLVVDGLKFTPCGPSMIDARDAILRADQTKNASANRAKLWEVFARHGMGYSAAGYDGMAWLESTVFNAAADLPPDLSTGNRPPKVTGRPSALPGLGEAFSYDINATDPDGDAVVFELTEGPPGMTVDAQTGLVKWSASFVEQRVKITVTDGKGGRAVHGFSIPVITRLTVGQNISIAADEQTIGIAEVAVPAGTQILQATLRDGVGNPDLVLGSVDGDLYYSVESGSTETVSIPLPGNGLWMVFVMGSSTYSGVSLQASLPVPQLIDANTSMNISGVATSEAFYRVAVPAGTASFTVATSGGDGDLDLYLKRNSPAVCSLFLDLMDQCAYDRYSWGMDTVEFIQVADPGGSDWYIDVAAVTAFSGARLRTITTTPGQAVPKPPPSGWTLSSGVVEDVYLYSVTEPKLVTSPTYRIEVPEGAKGLTVNLTTTTAGADVDLFLRYESNVAAQDGKIVADHSSEKSGTGNETIVVTPSSTPPLRAGWYSVAFRLATTGTSVQGQLTATIGAPATGPRIARGGVVLATGTPVVSRLSPNSAFTIFGEAFSPDGTSALSPTVDEHGRIATNLANTCVEINGVRTPLFVALPTQINGQTPEGIAPGSASVVVVSGCGTASEARSAAETVEIGAVSPGFFHFVNNQNGRNPLAALHGGGPTLAAADGVIPGMQCSPAAQSEFVSLFSTGLGLTNPLLKAGEVPGMMLPDTSGQARVTGEVRVSIGGIPLAAEDIYYVGTAPCCAGLYQLVVRIPAAAADGDLPVVMTVDGVASPAGSYIAVRAPR